MTRQQDDCGKLRDGQRLAPGFHRLALGVRQLALLALTVAALTAPACRQEEVTHARVAKGVETSSRAAPGMAMPPGGGAMPGAGGMPNGGPMANGQVAPPPPPDPANALQWTLPAGWTAKLEGGMRYATLRPATPGKVEVSIVMLPGPAGGELANVNRWRGQLGLAPVDEAGLAAGRKLIQSRAGAIGLYELVSEGEVKSRMTAALLAATNGNTWFVKMTGDADPVAANQAEFVHLLESLYFGANGAP